MLISTRQVLLPLITSIPNLLGYPFKVIPQFCIAHSYCARFLSHYSALTWARARTKRKRFSSTKLDSEINAPLLLNEHGDPHFLFYKFNENIIFNNLEKKLAEIYGYFAAKWNKCYRERNNGPNRATLNFRKFKVAVDPMYKFVLNFAKSCIFNCLSKKISPSRFWNISALSWNQGWF